MESPEACASLLSEGERARWQKFRFERNRREYLATRALVRTALSRHGATLPEAWRFSCNEFGKPATEPASGLHFNLANSLGLVVCLIAEGAEVGVDVESLERAEQIVELAPGVFSPQNWHNWKPWPVRTKLTAPCRYGRSRSPTSRRAAWGCLTSKQILFSVWLQRGNPPGTGPMPERQGRALALLPARTCRASCRRNGGKCGRLRAAHVGGPAFAGFDSTSARQAGKVVSKGCRRAGSFLNL